MTVILLAPPGGGKGTQAKLLTKHYQMDHLSTGHMLRGALQQGTPLGREASKFVTAGLLVPDEIVIGIIKERLLAAETKGVILDGFPRTVAQAEALDHLLADTQRSVDLVINLEISPETSIQRLSGRRVCGQCGMEYHLLFYPPSVAGVCDQCGGGLVQRNDDVEEIIKNRWRVSEDERSTLQDFYAKRGLLRKIDGDGTIDQVFHRVVEVLGRTTQYG
ncbi:MAG: adenylate kinase [Candidatus Latescibacteria bacterium]|nr:adenylate kinase [Candidatus Latescibacterota bacterium]